MQSIPGTNFRACSASSKMWTAFTCTIHAEHTQNKFCHTLSIRGTNFIACWAYAEMLKSRIPRPNRIQFSKISCYRPLGPYGFGFCKKSQKTISCLCCVPINGDRNGNHFEGEIMKLPNRSKVKKERFFSLFTCIFSETNLWGENIEKILDKQRSCIRT